MQNNAECAFEDVNEELRKYLIHYCTSSISPGYAVMLRGRWGSGKTWFVNSLRKSLDGIPDKRSLYVSLFGVSKPSDVTDQFFQQIHPKLANKAVQQTWSIAKSLLKGTVKLDFDGDGKADGTLQMSIPDLEKWASTAGAVLIFDDLERVGMEAKDILGYINQFVEHDGYRVIVIANEEQCVESTPGFPTIKEKVIGRTFEISPNVISALDRFLDEIKESAQSFEILSQRKQLIAKVFDRSKKGNLRLLRQATLDFDDLMRCLSEVNSELSQHINFLDKIVEDLYSLSIEYRAGELSIDGIHSLDNPARLAARVFSRKDGKEFEPSKSELAFDRHEITDSTYFALPSITYAAFFSRGYLSANEVSQGIGSSQYLMTGETPSWQRLWYKNRLSDDEFSTLTKSVQRKFFKLENTDEGEIFHIVGILLDLSTKKLVPLSPQKMLVRCKSVVIALGRKNLLDVGPKFKRHRQNHDNFHAYGLSFYGENLNEFKEFSDFYFSTKNSLRISALKNWAKDWTYELKDDPDLWIQRITDADESLSWFINQPIFAFVPTQEFTRYLFQLPTLHILKISDAFRMRYEFIRDEHDWRLEELSFLKELEKILCRRLKSAPKTLLSRFIFREYFVTHLREIIESLEQKQSLCMN